MLWELLKMFVTIFACLFKQANLIISHYIKNRSELKRSIDFAMIHILRVMIHILLYVFLRTLQDLPSLIIHTSFFLLYFLITSVVSFSFSSLSLSLFFLCRITFLSSIYVIFNTLLHILSFLFPFYSYIIPISSSFPALFFHFTKITNKYQELNDLYSSCQKEIRDHLKSMQVLYDSILIFY